MCGRNTPDIEILDWCSLGGTENIYCRSVDESIFEECIVIIMMVIALAMNTMVDMIIKIEMQSHVHTIHRQ